MKSLTYCGEISDFFFEGEVYKLGSGKHENWIADG